MGDKIALSSSVRIKYKDASKVLPIVVNRLYSFSKRCTWNDVLNDLTTDDGHNIDKLDEVTVSVSDKMANGVTFEPDFAEEIRVVHDFDKRLKYVQFDIIRDAPPSNDKNNNQTNSNAQNAFDVLMRKANTQANSKVPSKLDETAPRFTGKYVKII